LSAAWRISAGHSKQFPAAQVTAVVHYDGNVGMNYIDPGEALTLGPCWFEPGLRAPSGFEPAGGGLPLGKIDPVVLSEVLSDLSALAAKAGS
jgi:hypothetical protein